MSDLIEIFVFASSIMAGIFNALDNVYLGEHSMLDIFISLFILDRTFWFVFRVLGHDPGPDPMDSDPSPPMEGTIHAVDENYQLSKDIKPYVPSESAPKGFSWKYQGPDNVRLK